MNLRKLRGVRGAIDVERDEPECIVAATRTLLEEVVARNGVDIDDIASIFFSVTRDLNATFPARAAHQLGWFHVPMLHFNEIDVPGSPDRLVRILMHVNTERSQDEIEHVYLGRAVVLRPDLVRTRK